MGSSDEWSEFQEIIDSTPELDMCVDPRVYGGGNRYKANVAASHVQQKQKQKIRYRQSFAAFLNKSKEVLRTTPVFLYI